MTNKKRPPECPFNERDMVLWGLHLATLPYRVFGQAMGSLSNMTVFLSVAAHPGTTAREIGQNTGLSARVISRALRRHRLLGVDGELYWQIGDETDRRLKRLYLSPVGRKVLEQGISDMMRCQEHLLEHKEEKSH